MTDELKTEMPDIRAMAESDSKAFGTPEDLMAEKLIEHAEFGEVETATNDPFGQEEPSSATIEGDNPHITAAIMERMKSEGMPVTTEMLLATIKRIESEVRKNYVDPDRITVPVSARAIIRQDFTRAVPVLPNHIKFPTPALSKGKPIKVGEVKVPAVYDRDGEEVVPAQKLPIFVAAAPNGEPLRDSKGDFVVIDPQNGAIRQRVVGKGLVPKRSWWKQKLAQLKGWWKSWRFDFKFIKRSK